ncbi:hypothetical protein Droror1_Dr00025586 [Drosera rotundifolia]
MRQRYSKLNSLSSAGPTTKSFRCPAWLVFGSPETTSPATRWLRTLAISGATAAAGSGDVSSCARGYERRRWQGAAAKLGEKKREERLGARVTVVWGDGGLCMRVKDRKGG